MLLEVERLDVRYGRNHAIRALDLELAEGEIVTVLGANGAGKSSLLKAVQGTVKPAAGAVRLNGETVTGWSSPKRVRAGLTLVPEGRQIFVSLTVHEICRWAPTPAAITSTGKSTRSTTGFPTSRRAGT